MRMLCKSRLVKSLMIAICIVVITACTPPKRANRQLETAKMLFKERDYSGAAEYLKPLAEQGDADAEYALGYLYFYGKGVPQNVLKGRELIQSAAKKNQANALKAIDVMGQHEASLADFPKEKKAEKEAR